MGDVVPSFSSQPTQADQSLCSRSIYLRYIIVGESNSHMTSITSPKPGSADEPRLTVQRPCDWSDGLEGA